MKLSKSFTLIELLIVIVIIGILAVALIPRLKGMQDKAKDKQMLMHINQFKTTVLLAQTSSKKTLKDITGSGCSGCSCDITGSLQLLDDSNPCLVRLNLSLRNIEIAAGISSGDLSYMLKDPRGSPYILDENEGERQNSPCSYDHITHVGKDGIFIGAANIGLSDNKQYVLASMGCPSAY